MGLITSCVESGLLTAYLIMAHDTFGPMARVDTDLLKARNFIGPNYGPYRIRPVNRPLFFWAHSKTGLYFSLLNAHLPVRPDNSFGMLAARGASGTLSARFNFRPFNGPRRN